MADKKSRNTEERSVTDSQSGSLKIVNVSKESQKANSLLGVPNGVADGDVCASAGTSIGEEVKQKCCDLTEEALASPMERQKRPDLEV